MTAIIHPDAPSIASARRPVPRRQARARPVGSRHRLAVRHPDDSLLLLGDQHLSVDLDDPAVLHQPQPEHVVPAAAFRRPGQLYRHPHRRGRLVRLQTTARFVISTVALQVFIGFGLALLINRQFRSHSFWTTIILLPMMLSPAVVGNFWTLLLQPQIGPFNYVISLFTGIRRARSA
jgi:hypothetical protein